MNFRKGKTYRCIEAKSNAYKVGKEYVPYLNNDGVLCLKGDDGFEDPCGKLMSKFIEVK